MAILVSADISPRVITVPTADGTSITVQSLLDQCRVWEEIPANMSYPRLALAAGKTEVRPGKFTGIVLTLQNAVLAFEARGGPDFVACNVDDGDLVAVDANGALLSSPIQTTAFTQVNYAASTSATLISAGSGVTAQDKLDIADQVWNEAQAEHAAAGSFGVTASEVEAIKAVTDLLPNAGALSDLATILTDTNELQGDWADGGRLDLLLDAIPTTAMRGTDNAATAADLATAQADLDILTGTDGATLATTQALYAPAKAGDLMGLANNAITAAKLAADAVAEIQSGLATAAALTTVDTVVDAIRVITDALGATAAANLALSAGASGIVVGAAEAGTLSTTQMTSNLTEETNNHYVGRVIIWTSGVLAGQATDITAYLGSTGRLTFTAVTEAPSPADAFLIV